MESGNTYWADRALLEWQLELGATEAISDAPVNRYDLPSQQDRPRAAAARPVPARPGTARSEPNHPAAPQAVPDRSGAARSAPAAPAQTDAVAEAERAAAMAPTLDALRAALAAYPHCDLRKGARNTVFADGIAGARVMIVGEAPGREEDRAGKPFVGRAGQLLDRMLAAIDLGRVRADAPVYITNLMPWRPPQNRDPSQEEIAMMRPFLLRHIALAGPEVLLILGNWSCQALLGQRGITRLRGQWTTAAGLPALPVFHPAYLLRNPEAKREAWADLLSLNARLRDG